MSFGTGISFIIIAGLINASFVIPIKHIKSFSNEKIWFFHSLIGIAILPWLLLHFASHNAANNYSMLQPYSWALLVSSGLIFGIGQLCFAYAIEKVGIGLSFTINLSLGITIGSLFVLIYRNVLFTMQGLWVMTAIVLILSGLLINYYANRVKQTRLIYESPPAYRTGWLLATLAGIASGLQNIAFITVAYHYQSADSYWVWPPFLITASLPMLIGFWYKMNKNRTLQRAYINQNYTAKNFLFIVFMGLCFTGSLALYSSGMNQLSLQQQIAGWPTLMVSIILTSQFWGWLYGETKGFSKQQNIYRLWSIGLLVAAIAILSFK